MNALPLAALPAPDQYPMTDFSEAAASIEVLPDEVSAGTADELTISDVAREFDLTLRALRFYEDRGLLKPRRVGTHRLYGPAERQVLARIVFGKRLGFTLTEIADLLARGPANGEDEPPLRLTLAECHGKLAELEARRAGIEAALAHLQTQLAPDA
jgi:DNA-binding transcriptional MerR regulator